MEGMQKAHIATPWMRDQYGNVVDKGGRDRIVLAGFALSTGRPNEEAEANTDFVFRACNAHGDLVKALEALKAASGGEFAGWHDKYANAIALANAALAKAKGGAA